MTVLQVVVAFVVVCVLLFGLYLMCESWTKP
jgi:hypothetical protein